MKLSDRIKRSGIPDSEIACDLEITLEHLSKIASGDIEPTLSQGIKLADMLNCEPTDILDFWRMEKEYW